MQLFKQYLSLLLLQTHDTETTLDTSPEFGSIRNQNPEQFFQEPEVEQANFRKRSEDLSPLELLPDPTDLDMDPVAPLRQSPASALPPGAIEDQEPGCVSPTASFRGEYEPLNPDIDRPSPPRQGSSRIFENPFEVTDEEAHPVTPENLSPSHVFESTTLEEELLLQQQQQGHQFESGPEQIPVEPRPVFDSRTFVIKKTPSPTNSNQIFGFPEMTVSLN